MEDLQQQWKDLYATRLPSMAKARDDKQSKWPVYLDHCFARIILDNAVGKDAPWTDSVKSPAIKHMSEQQLRDAIDLGEAIADGREDINRLNEHSLQLRGKQGPGKKRTVDTSVGSNAVDDSEPREKKKQRTQDGNISRFFLPSPGSPKADETIVCAHDASEQIYEAASKAADENIDVQLKRIAESKLTPFRKRALSMLCQVPRGRYSTYQAMSDYITKTSHKTCARAVGSAMRNNPFAPEVPCHRILAADGTLGGFCGHWGEQGKFASRKHELLHEEGVRFDSRGKVKGPPFRDFKQLPDW